jgi:hypothetical protein
VYGVVAWSDPVPFAAPSVVEDVPLPGWWYASDTQRPVAAMTARALTVPLEPSFAPFGLFCMTAVADLESLMGATSGGG